LCVSSLTAQPITATTSRESENPQDQSPRKKQRTSCLFTNYTNSLPSTSINCEAQLVKYMNAINEPGFSADVEPNICTSSEYLSQLNFVLSYVGITEQQPDSATGEDG